MGKILYCSSPGAGYQTTDVFQNFSANLALCERRTPRDDTLCPNFNGLGPSLTRSGKRGGETTRDNCTTATTTFDTAGPWLNSNRKEPGT